MRSSAAAHGTPQTVWQRYFYRHGRFFATYQASMLLLTVACIAVLILPPFFHLIHTAWVRREIPYTFTPISSYLRDANFFARANAEPMLLWQTVKLAPSLAAVNTSAEGDGGARVPTSRDTLYSLTRPSLSYLLRFQHLLETCEVSLAEVEALSRDSDLETIPVPYEPLLPHPLGSPLFRLSDICYRTTPEARCLVLSPAVYWDYNQQQLMEDPDLAATVRRRSADLLSARGVHAPPEMLWENLRLGGNDPTIATLCTDGHPGCPAIDTVSSPLPIPVTVEGFHLAVAAVETWSHSVPARAILQTLIHHVVARLEAVPLNCTGSDDAFECPTLPPATLHLDPRDRTVRALFQTDYSRFAVEHYFLAVGCLGLFAYIYYTFYRLDLVKSKIWLGIATTLMLVCSMFLALTICTSVSRAHPLLPWEILPFFVIIVGVENVHAITQSVVQLPFDLPVRERIGLGLSHVGPTMLFRLLAEVAGLTLGVGLSTEIVREFCIFLILSIIVDFVFQVTFFITVLSIDIRRLELSDLYHRRRQSHPGGEHAGTADLNHPHTLAAASSSSTSSSGFRGRPYDKSFSAMLLLAPAIVFRHLHRLWMRQRAYSIFLLVAFVGLLYYLYDHTSHAVNIIFPAQENAFISNLLLRDSAQILGQVMAGFHSIEVSRRLVVRYLLSYPTHRAYLQVLPAAAAVGSRGGEAHALWTTASLGRWGLILRPLALLIDAVAADLPALIRRWSLPYWLVVIWAAVAMVLVVLAVRGIIRGRGYRPTPHPLWRLLAPVGLATASHGPDVRIDHAGAVDLNPGFLTDLRALRPWGRHHVLTISQDGSCALQTMRDLAGYVSGGPVFSRWRTVAEADRMATPPSLLAGLPADLTHRRSDPRFATDYSRRWGALTLDGLKVYLWAAAAESSTTANVEGTFFTVPTADVAHTRGPVTCLALLHNVGANDRWELHSEPPSAPAMRKPLTSTPVLAVGRANGSLEFYVIDEVACNVQRMVEARLPSAPCAQVWASANYSVCADLAGGIHVLYLAQTPGLPATLSALYSLDVQRDSVTALTLTPTCPDLLITGHRSGAVHIWNLATACHMTALSRGGSRPGSPNLPDLNTFAWPPASLTSTANTGPSSLPYPTTTSPFLAPFAVPSTTPGADGHVAVLGSPHHTAAVRRLLVYPELNGLRNVTRLFVVSAGDDATAHVWQITREEYYQRPPSPSSSATFQPTAETKPLGPTMVVR
ncbi:hypothetical protein IWQ60_010035 [Tieghemiomyces parasiticus]|uniref:Sterol regulatory element-binding protein cleavage-activating protein n=1 Tax=Tieghemiomyces parasiticus TaxID=78921 RepID=A0A9W7ZVP5_9FUNG|nr:hypothetical protein IWQ60_010035 [Tieghemiomyces parasiticus]